VDVDRCGLSPDGLEWRTLSFRFLKLRDFGGGASTGNDFFKFGGSSSNSRKIFFLEVFFY